MFVFYIIDLGNTDIKFIWNGSDAKALVYYITEYITKNNWSFYDTFVNNCFENLGLKFFN